MKKDNVKVEVEQDGVKFNVALRTVGGVVMATSIGWGFLAFLSLPTLRPTPEQFPEVIHVPDDLLPSARPVSTST